MAASKDVNVAVRFGRSSKVKNLFAYSVQSIQYSKVISLNLLEFFVSICDSQNIPVNYDFSVDNFQTSNETDYIIKESNIVSTNLEVEYSIMDMIKRRSTYKHQWEDLFKKRISAELGKTASTVSELLKQIHTKFCEDEKIWFSNTKQLLFSLLYNSQIPKEKWIDFNIKEKEFDDNEFVTFVPKQCIVRIDACKKIYQPLNIFRKKNEKQKDSLLQTTDEFEINGLLVLHDSMEIKETKENLSCSNDFSNTNPRIILF